MQYSYERVSVDFKVLPYHLHGKTKESQEEICQDSNYSSWHTSCIHLYSIHNQYATLNSHISRTLPQIGHLIIYSQTIQEHDCFTCVLNTKCVIKKHDLKSEQNQSNTTCFKYSYLVTNVCNIRNASCISVARQVCCKVAYGNYSCQIMFTVPIQ